MNDTPARKPGRTHAANVVRRRIEAEAYLEQYFPKSAALWVQLRSGTMSVDERTGAVNAMTTEAKAIHAPMPAADQDKITLNPEQAVARALQRMGDRDAAIAQCRAELSALNDVRKAITEVLVAHQDAAKSDAMMIAVAAAHRPSIDREIERRAIDILRAGVGRADVIRLKQNADKLWKRPHDWSGLSAASGRFQIRELPASSGIERELLPPSADILHYLRNVTAFRADVAQAQPDVIMTKIEAELADWITLHYPGPTVRKPAVIAQAWAVLIMLNHHAMQESNRQVIVSLPSVWAPGRVMRIESRD